MSYKKVTIQLEFFISRLEMYISRLEIYISRLEMCISRLEIELFPRIEELYKGHRALLLPTTATFLQSLGRLVHI